MKTHSKLYLFLIIASFAIMGVSCSDKDNNTTTPTPSNSSYFYHNGHSYLIVKEKKSWADAAADAFAKGGYLAEIGDKSEQNAIYQGIIKSGISAAYTSVVDGGGTAYIWIGATDRLSEGVWTWNGANQPEGTSRVFWNGDNTGKLVDGSYANWGGTAAGKINEPDNFTDSQASPNGQNAAAIALAKWPADYPVTLGIAGEWNDIAETNKIYYIIEFNSIKE